MAPLAAPVLVSVARTSRGKTTKRQGNRVNKPRWNAKVAKPPGTSQRWADASASGRPRHGLSRLRIGLRRRTRYLGGPLATLAFQLFGSPDCPGQKGDSPFPVSLKMPRAERLAGGSEPPNDSTSVEAMAHRSQTADSRTLYKLRNQIPKPVFDIVRSVMGFRQDLLHGIDRVRGEWNRVTMRRSPPAKSRRRISPARHAAGNRSFERKPLDVV